MPLWLFTLTWQSTSSWWKTRPGTHTKHHILSHEKLYFPSIWFNLDHVSPFRLPPTATVQANPSPLLVEVVSILWVIYINFFRGTTRTWSRSTSTSRSSWRWLMLSWLHYDLRSWISVNPQYIARICKNYSSSVDIELQWICRYSQNKWGKTKSCKLQSIWVSPTHHSINTNSNLSQTIRSSDLKHIFSLHFYTLFFHFTANCSSRRTSLFTSICSTPWLWALDKNHCLEGLSWWKCDPSHLGKILRTIFALTAWGGAAREYQLPEHQLQCQHVGGTCLNFIQHALVQKRRLKLCSICC